MVQRLIVPVDGSPMSWTALDVAVSLAQRRSGAVDVVQVEFDPNVRSSALARLHHELTQRDMAGVEVSVDVELTVTTVAGQLENVMLRHPEATLVMSSHGRGRSATIVGSVTQDVLARTFGPVMLVGPHAEVSDFSGPVVVSVDGSSESEAALPLAVAWATELRVHPWIVHTAGSEQPPFDVLDSAYLHRLAREVRVQSGQPADFDELHGGNPAVAVPEFAERLGASLIVASSHGRSGWSRLTMGSVTSGFVRHATCPVLVMRLHRPATAEVGGGQPAFAF